LRKCCAEFVTPGSLSLSAIGLTTGVTGHRSLLEESANVGLTYPAVVASVIFRQASRSYRGETQQAYLRQKRVGSIATRSPILIFVTLAPTWIIVPADS